MNSILLRTFCGIAVVALLFAGLASALDGRQEYAAAAAAHDDAKRLELTQRQAAESARQALDVLRQAVGVLERLEPVPREWTVFPLAVKAELDAPQTAHLLRLLGKSDPWSFLRTLSLNIQSKCGTEPCSTFLIDLHAEAYAPVQQTEEPAWPASSLN